MLQEEHIVEAPRLHGASTSRRNTAGNLGDSPIEICLPTPQLDQDFRSIEPSRAPELKARKTCDGEQKEILRKDDISQVVGVIPEQPLHEDIRNATADDQVKAKVRVSDRRQRETAQKEDV